MAIKDTQKDVLLGQTVIEQTSNIQHNFDELYANDDSLSDELATKLNSAPNGSTPLISGNKINTAYLPDTVLGQLEYKGTFDATVGQTGVSLQKGYYFIANKAGAKNPDGSNYSETWATGANGNYAVGDWAVYNGSGWNKVDNTDAVTMVNGQVGYIQTYKGDYSSTTVYHQGDIVKGRHPGGDAPTEDSLFLYVGELPRSGESLGTRSYWKEVGRIYDTATETKNGLMSTTNLSNLNKNTSARHTHSNKSVLDATTASYTTAEKTKLGKIDNSLLGVTASDIGKVKDVTVNGKSVLNSDGTAKVQAVQTIYVNGQPRNAGEATVSLSELVIKKLETATTDITWNVIEIDGVRYYALDIQQYVVARIPKPVIISVKNTNGQDIVYQVGEYDDGAGTKKDFLVIGKEKQDVIITYLTWQ